MGEKKKMDGMGGMKTAGAGERRVPTMALLVDRRSEREMIPGYYYYFPSSAERGRTEGWMDGMGYIMDDTTRSVWLAYL